MYFNWFEFNLAWHLILGYFSLSEPDKSVFASFKWIHPFNPEFIIVIFIHYKPNSWLAVDEDDLKWVTKEQKYCYVQYY